MHSINRRILFLVFVLLLSFSTTPQAFSQWVPTATLTSPYVLGFGTVGTTLFVGTTGGIFLSNDNGTTWTPANTGFAGGSVYSFAAKGSNVFAGSDSGIFLSTNMGGRWIKINTGQSDKFVTSFAQSDGNLYAGFASGVLLSTNGGTDWQNVSTGLPGSRTLSMAAIGQNIFAGSTGGVYVTTNSGAKWSSANKGLLNNLIFTLVASGQTLYAGSNASVASSTNYGAQWIPDTAGMSFTVADALAAIGSDIFCGTFVQTGTVYVSTNAGIDWQAINDGLPGTIRPIYAVTISGSNLYIGTNGDGVWRRPLSDFGISAVSQTAQLQVTLSNYPNPFTRSTKCTFTSSESGAVQITVVNPLGEAIAQLFDGELDAGEHSFEWNASGAPAGTYFCIVRANGGVTRRSCLQNSSLARRNFSHFWL